MSDFKSLKKEYKKPPATFGDAKKIKVSLAQEQRERRKKRRTNDFEKIREERSPCSTVSQNDEPKTKLLKWKNEQKRRKEQQSQKKPPFVVGIVRHHYYSPVSETKALCAPKEKKKTVAQVQKNSNVKKRITKATEKRLLAKAAKQQQLASSGNKQSSSTETSSNDKVQSDRRESFAPPDHKFNPAGLPKCFNILFGDVNIEDSTLNGKKMFAHDQLTETAGQEACCNSDSIEAITLKMSSDEHETTDPSRRKQATSMVSGSSELTDKLATTGADVLENPDVPIEKKYTVEYFKCVWNEEKNRLQKLCEEWTEIQSQDDIKEDIRYLINQAVGHTSMLIKNKFEQFYRLIQNCERNDGDVLVISTDLHGFWDMMYIEVKDCDSRFAKLEKLRARRWQEDRSPIAVSTEPEKKTGTKKKSIPVRKSSMRASLLSARNKKVGEIQDNEKNSQELTNVNNGICVTPFITDKTAVSVFRRGSNVSRTDRFLETPTNYMYTSTPLPVNVTSKTSSQLSTPLIAMKVSQLYNKSTLIDTTLHITPEQTTLRMSSIEKSERLVRSKSLRMKFAHKTDLNDKFATMKLSDEKLEIGQNSGVSSKKTNKSDELDSNKRNIEEKTDSGTDGSGAKTVIEKSMNEKSTLKLSPHSNDLRHKTPTERKNSVKETSSNKSSKIRSFARSSRHPILNKIRSASGIPVNISSIDSTPRSASLSHDVRNVRSKITPKTDRIPNKRNSSIKTSSNKADTPQVSRKSKPISSHTPTHK